MGHESFGEKIIFSSAPVPGINNDQSLNVLINSKLQYRPILIRTFPRWSNFLCESGSISAKSLWNSQIKRVSICLTSKNHAGVSHLSSPKIYI